LTLGSSKFISTSMFTLSGLPPPPLKYFSLKNPNKCPSDKIYPFYNTFFVSNLRHASEGEKYQSIKVFTAFSNY